MSPSGAGPTALLRALLLRSDPPSDDEVAAAIGDAGDGELAASFAALRPDAVARQRAAGIAEPDVRAGLDDLDRKHRLYGSRSVAAWLLGVLRGDVVQLGRLQVEVRPGLLGHALHVPEAGPLDPDAVDASLARIREVTGATAFTCTSWLLDPALSTDLPDSNIARFAARFELVAADSEPFGAGDAAAAKFVFRRPVAEVLDPAVVVPHTSLERAVAHRLRRGYRWSQPIGRLASRFAARYGIAAMCGGSAMRDVRFVSVKMPI